MGWNVESIKVEEKVISNPKLYLKRAEHYIMLQDYGQALKECKKRKEMCDLYSCKFRKAGAGI